MVTVIPMNGTRLDGYSYSYKWHEIGWLVISTNGMRLDGYSYSYDRHETGWLQLFLQMA